MSTSAKDLITLEMQDDIALVGLNRPSKCNAINEPLLQAFAGALAIANRKARVCIIFGHGDHFSAGLDLDWMRAQMTSHASAGESPGRSQKSRWFMDAMARTRVPHIVAIHGAAVGLGFELAAAAHIRVADETARFSLPEGRRGIFVGGGGAVRISRLIGVARMQDMMLTGRTYDAAEAAQYNIVQYVVPAGAAVQKALELARQICKNSTASNAAVVQGLPRIHELPMDDGLYWEDIMARTTFGDEAVARISEFLDKPSNDDP